MSGEMGGLVVFLVGVAISVLVAVAVIALGCFVIRSIDRVFLPDDHKKKTKDKP